MEEPKKTPHTLLMEDRGRLTMTGVKDVESFDEETLVVYTDLGEITVRGEQIRVGNFSAATGDFSATGSFSSFAYAQRLPKRSGFFARVFQ